MKKMIMSKNSVTSNNTYIRILRNNSRNNYKKSPKTDDIPAKYLLFGIIYYFLPRI